VQSRCGDRVFGVRDGPEPIAMLDEAALFESAERWTDASSRDIDAGDDLALAKSLIGVFQEKAE
jgi:hypothetical protein